MSRSRSPFALTAAIAVVALLALLFYGLGSASPDRSIDDAIERGDREGAPAFTLPKLDGGGDGSLADYRGQVVVVNFWASWCEPCREESPLLQRWHERISKSDGTVLGVDALDVTEDARDFAREYELTYPMLRDRDGEALDLYGVRSYPETFVVDRKGKIAASQRGPVDEAWMRRYVAPLIEEGA